MIVLLGAILLAVIYSIESLVLLVVCLTMLKKKQFAPLIQVLQAWPTRFFVLRGGNRESTIKRSGQRSSEPIANDPEAGHQCSCTSYPPE